MAIDYVKLMARRFPDVEHRYSRRDTILYALGIGLGADPLDPGQLRFVYERELKAMPTMAAVLGYIGFWVKEPDTGIDWVKVVAAEQGIAIHRPLPPEGAVVGRLRLTGIVDKGTGRGALIYSEREVIEKDSGALLATVTQTLFCRGDGGFGGPSGPVREPHPLPARAPDLACDLATAANQALLYRLSGDGNPLHADPEVARRAGFERPILHGLATLGVACHAIVRALCAYEPERLARIEVRYSRPVYPGETIRTEMWRDGRTVGFRARALPRDVVVLDSGLAELAA
ncbi:MAG: MaoC family dehydratase N-terminal domain-containing protein [Proteobacteria bacterium]|nr:MaoC family dehydratase N-terminal domain-containing protein [Pseudomonadota bacterium]